MYVVDVGFFYSDTNSEVFQVLPKNYGDVSYDENGPRYIIKINLESHRTNTMDYIQWNPESKKSRMIIVLADPSRHGFDDLSRNDLKILLRSRTAGTTKIIELKDLYELQQEKLAIEKEKLAIEQELKKFDKYLYRENIAREN